MNSRRKLVVKAMLLAACLSPCTLVAASLGEAVKPIATPELVFEEVDGLGAIEAEHFHKQALQDKRAWHITSSKNAPELKPDADPPHVAGASGGAYLEIRPDTRRTDKDKFNPARNQTAKTTAPFPYASGQYHVTLQAVGESDGKSTYEVLVNDASAGDFTCPLSTETFEEGPKLHTTWKNIAINQGDVVTVSSKIASEDGKEHSRARSAWLTFEPADESTKAAAAKLRNGGIPAAGALRASQAGRLTDEQDDRYLRYCIARLSA